MFSKYYFVTQHSNVQGIKKNNYTENLANRSVVYCVHNKPCEHLQTCKYAC